MCVWVEQEEGQDVNPCSCEGGDLGFGLFCFFIVGGNRDFSSSCSSVTRFLTVIGSTEKMNVFQSVFRVLLCRKECVDYNMSDQMITRLQYLN